MLKRLLLLNAATLVLAAVCGPTVTAGKPVPPPAPWPCQVTLRDAGGDVIISDGKGPYVNGQGGVSCTITADPNATKYGWLYLYFPRPTKSTRAVLYLGQTRDADGGPGYNGFASRGSFEVKGLTQTAYNPGNPDFIDIRPFRANQSDRQFASGTGQFSGDSNFTGEQWSTGSSSVFVKPGADGCTWDFWFDPNAGPFSSTLGDSAPTRYAPRVIQLKEGTGYAQTRGYYAMPFGATVRIINVPKLGC